MNYWLLEARHGQEALAILEQHGDGVDLVISDVVMPMMGGIALLHAMRQRSMTVPVAMLIGHPLEEAGGPARPRHGGLAAQAGQPGATGRDSGQDTM
jgi:two-component system capsular synthesis sensor histidine kinase RcsC